MSNMEELQRQINTLRQELESLKGEVFRNNFSAYQDFNKASNFTTKLKVPSYDTAPATCSVGEIIEVSGKLEICSATDTWTVVGAQTA